jgi:uncharacterized protein (DUF488 family)
MRVFTIGFTGKSAEQFFGILRNAGIKRLLDIRLKNVSQLAGFAKRDDLAFFLRELCGAEYVYEPRLAPTAEMLDAYRAGTLSWEDYQPQFQQLLSERHAEGLFQPVFFEVPTVLLCSEPTAEQCHRRLVLEYLQENGFSLEIVHL